MNTTPHRHSPGLPLLLALSDAAHHGQAVLLRIGRLHGALLVGLALCTMRKKRNTFTMGLDDKTNTHKPHERLHHTWVSPCCMHRVSTSREDGGKVERREFEIENASCAAVDYAVLHARLVREGRRGRGKNDKNMVAHRENNLKEETPSTCELHWHAATVDSIYVKEANRKTTTKGWVSEGTSMSTCPSSIGSPFAFARSVR